MKILCAVLTYNRLSLLKRCIGYINNQTQKIDQLIVINNGSTDNTENWLLSNNIKYITMPKGGSAQGWDRAVNYAIEKKFEYIWLMDDDGYPDEKSLYELCKNYKDNMICLSSIVLNEDEKEKLVFPMPIVNRFKPIIFSNFSSISNLSKLKNKLYPFVHLFNGCLLDVEKIKNIGGIDGKLFHHGVELDIYYRMIKSNSAYTLKTAKHFHPNVSKRKISDMWIYYYIKNSLIINKKYLNFYKLRNLIVITAAVLRIYNRNGVIDLYNYTMGKKSKIFYQAIINGLKGSSKNLDEYY
tara:strand:+ start:113 stop:1003 length:891 start_codon:yes stop_codon:yes gene_type:complete